jgi:hypothetical protein
MLKHLHHIPGKFRFQQIYDLQSSFKQARVDPLLNTYGTRIKEPRVELQSLFKQISIPKEDAQRKPLWVNDDFKFMVKTKEGTWSYSMNLRSFEVFNVSISHAGSGEVVLLTVEIKPMSGVTYVVIQDTVVYDIKIQNELDNCSLECFEISVKDSEKMLRMFPKRQLPGQEVFFIQETFNKQIKNLSIFLCFFLVFFMIFF